MSNNDWTTPNNENEKPRQIFPGEDPQPFVPTPMVVPATTERTSRFPVKTLIAILVLLIVAVVAFAAGKTALGYLGDNKDAQAQADFDAKYGSLLGHFDEAGQLRDCRIPEEYFPAGLVGDIAQAGGDSCLLWLSNGSGGPEVQAEVHLGQATSQLVAYHHDGTSAELGNFEPTSTPPAGNQLEDWTFEPDLFVVPGSYNVDSLYKEAQDVKSNGCVYSNDDFNVAIGAPVDCSVVEKIAHGYEGFFETYQWAKDWTPRKGLEGPALEKESINGYEVAGYWPGIPVEEKPQGETFTTASEAYAHTEVTLESLDTTPNPDPSINAVDVCVKVTMTMKDRFEGHKAAFKLPVVYAALPTGELLQVTETTGHADEDRYLAESVGCTTIHGIRHAQIQLAMASMEANPEGQPRGWLDGLKAYWTITV